MWGDYKVEMPKIEDGFKVFGDDELYLKDFDKDLKKLMISGDEKKGKINLDEYFVSGLGVQHKWIEPQEIGEITVGPYVVDMAIHNNEC